MNALRSCLLPQILLVVGSPLLLAIVELIHPQPHDLLRIDIQTWLAVHYAQIALFPLVALAVAWWVRDQSGVAAAVCRIAMFVFGAAWTSWDAVAGVGTGILIAAAGKSGGFEAWRGSIEAIWSHPIMGGGASLFAVMGSIALSVGTVAAGIVLKRLGHSWKPIAALVVVSFGVAVFQTHAWPGGPLTFGGIAIVSAWLLLERVRRGIPNDTAAQREHAADDGCLRPDGGGHCRRSPDE